MIATSGPLPVRNDTRAALLSCYCRFEVHQAQEEEADEVVLLGRPKRLPQRSLTRPAQCLHMSHPPCLLAVLALQG
jgi:hypothetical protein